MSKRNVQWFLAEIPQLVAKGLLPSDVADGLRVYYESYPRRSGLSLAILLFAILGALLIGLGVILTLGSNWDELGRPVRTVLSFMPLLLSQALAAFAILQRWESRPWRESSATLVFLSIGASIALIAQTYNLPGDPAAFLLTWALLGVPLIYVLDATTPVLLYGACLVGWTIAAQSQDSQAVLFWPLLALMAPYAAMQIRKNDGGGGAILSGWIICICACIGTGVSLEKILPGLWIVVYGCLFGALYLIGRFWLNDVMSIWRRPYYMVGAGGIGVMAVILSFSWPWDHIGWQFMRHGYGYNDRAGVMDYVILAALGVSVVTLLVSSVRRGHASAIPYGVFPFLALAGYVLAAFDTPDSVPALLFTVYLLALGLYTIGAGLRTERLDIINGGMFLIAALIVARFFDEDLPLFFRGIAFIVLGIAFLVVNIVILKRSAARQGAVR